MSGRCRACALLLVLCWSGFRPEARAQSNADNLRHIWADRSLQDTVRWQTFSNLIWEEYMYSKPDSAELLAGLLFDEARASGSRAWQAHAMNIKAISLAVRGDLDSAIVLIEQCISIRRSLGQLSHLAGLQSNLGNMYADQGDLDKAIAAYEESLDLGRQLGDSVLMASNLTNIGIAYQDLGLVGKASENLYRAIELRKAMNDEGGLAKAYAPLADVYVFLGDTAGALDLREKAAAIYEKLGDDRSLGVVYESLASTQASIGHIDEAIRLSTLSLDLLTRVGDVRSMSNSSRGLGLFLLETGRTEEAIMHLERSVAIDDSAGYDGLLVHALNALARGRLAQGRSADAEKLYQRALGQATALGIVDAKSTAARGLHALYKEQGRFREALAMNELAEETAASIKDEALVRAALRDQYAYTYRSKQAADSLAFAQERTIQAERLTNAQRTRGFLLGGLVLLLAFGAFAWDRYRTTRKQKAIIEASASKLAELDELKNRFFTNISHEFRTPLTLILGPAERRKKALATTPDKDAEKDTDLILQNGQRLLALIDQILDLNKLEAGKLKSTIVQADAMAVVGHLYRSLYSLAEAKGVTMDMRAEPETFLMDLDREKLTKVVHNLVSNAIKFTPAGGRLDLQLEADERRFRMRFTDTGIGIPPADLPHVFDRFYQSSRTPDDQMGTGVGLALTQELVRSLGGRISVESTLDVGSTFTVELPATRNAAVVTVPDQPIAPAVVTQTPVLSENGEVDEADERTLVLVVEDNADMAEHIAQSLGDAYRVAFAENGQLGVERAVELVPDIVVSDVMMPLKDGFALVAELKADERTSHIPVVLLTARSQVEDRISGLKRGADDYLSKPFHAEELQLRVGNLLALRDRWKARYAQGVPPEPVADVDIQPEDAFIQKVRELLESQLDNSELGANEIATALGLSRTQFFRKIKALTGESPANYIRHLRLVKAREMLRDPAVRVSEVAYSVGFNDPQYFSRAYSKAFGAPPSEDRS
ncbi:MAG: tetratricopeptide repeat protein [Flavobacteriales bacterium]|nr:tetratricopeptide repeat protein [Flavobacteriales bacterium]MCB9193533.1 tetratricopeptide repeat protein [Flavobacteriales bacterium]